MASYGPQLPPHLQKRKREPDDHEAPNAPSPKVTRRANEHEIELEEDSDDMTPSQGKCVTTPELSSRTDNAGGSPMGPSNGPFLPRIEQSSVASTAHLPMGPTPAPAPLDQMPRGAPTQPFQDSDDESDDDFGPALPSASDSRKSVHTTTSGAQMATTYSSSAPTSQRDEWMLAPPKSTGPRAPDPTKLKARGFASGRAAGSRGGGEISSIWTETPVEKAQRLKDAVLGRSNGTANAANAVAQAPSGPSTQMSANPDRIRSYTEQTRGKSLYEEHQAKQKSLQDKLGRHEEEDDPSKRAFDKEKDMAVSGRMNNSQRRELLNKAASYGGRFQKGSYL